MTQHVFADRAAALCVSAGIDIVVLAIDSPPLPGLTRAQFWTRERLATVKAWSDIIRRPPPHHGGPYIGLVGSVGMPEGGHPPDWNWHLDEKPGSPD